MPNIEIDVEMDKVTIEHQVIKRPDHISRSDWYTYWEGIELGQRALSIELIPCEKCGDPKWIG